MLAPLCVALIELRYRPQSMPQTPPILGSNQESADENWDSRSASLSGCVDLFYLRLLEICHEYLLCRVQAPNIVIVPTETLKTGTTALTLNPRNQWSK